MTNSRNIRIIDVNSEDGTARICGAVTKEGKICANNSGMRTNHPGRGRCWAHEETIDSIPLIYESKLKIPALEERMDAFINDKNILNLSGEIALNRSFLETFNKYLELAKSDDEKDISPELAEININDLTANLTRVSNTIGKLVKMQHDIETARKYMIHISSFYTMINTVAEIINDCVDEKETKVKIMERMGQIALPAPEL